MAVRLAINLDDADALPPDLKGLLVGRVGGGIIKVEVDRQRRRLEVPEPAVEFHCSLKDAALVCDRIRSEDRKHSRKSTRTYINRGTNWMPIFEGQVLTVSLYGKAHLDPTFFPDTVLPMVDDHDGPEVFTFGR